MTELTELQIGAIILSGKKRNKYYVLEMDLEGDYYLCAGAWKEDEEASFGMKIYINVK